VNHFGQRLLDLRNVRKLKPSDLAVSRTFLSRVENERLLASLGFIERLCQAYGIGLGRLFASEEDFEAMLALEEEFVEAVKPFLKKLNAEQRKQILATLEAAPKAAKRGRRACDRIKKVTFGESKKYTPQTVSSSNSPIYPMECSPSTPSPRTAMESRRLQRFSKLQPKVTCSSIESSLIH